MTRETMWQDACPVCGAQVATDRAEKHDQWHKRQDQPTTILQFSGRLTAKDAETIAVALRSRL
jgi:hypothetical protein